VLGSVKLATILAVAGGIGLLIKYAQDYMLGLNTIQTDSVKDIVYRWEYVQTFLNFLLDCARAFVHGNMPTLIAFVIVIASILVFEWRLRVVLLGKVSTTATSVVVLLLTAIYGAYLIAPPLYMSNLLPENVSLDRSFDTNFLTEGPTHRLWNDMVCSRVSALDSRCGGITSGGYRSRLYARLAYAILSATLLWWLFVRLIWNRDGGQPTQGLASLVLTALATLTVVVIPWMYATAVRQPSFQRTTLTFDQPTQIEQYGNPATGFIIAKAVDKDGADQLTLWLPGGVGIAHFAHGDYKGRIDDEMDDPLKSAMWESVPKMWEREK